MSKEFTKSYAINRIAELNEQIVEMTDNQNQTMRYLNRIRDENNQLKQQLAETEQNFFVFQEDSARNEQIYVRELAEKDKEIERLKNLFELDNEVVINQGKEIFDLRVQVLQQKQNQTQLAIQELEKVKDWLNEPFDEDGCFKNGGDLIDYIDQQIKELKGEKDVED